MTRFLLILAVALQPALMDLSPAVTWCAESLCSSGPLELTPAHTCCCTPTAHVTCECRVTPKPEAPRHPSTPGIPEDSRGKHQAPVLEWFSTRVCTLLPGLEEGRQLSDAAEAALSARTHNERLALRGIFLV